MTWLITALTIWIYYISGGDTFPHGAPYKACIDLHPKHALSNHRGIPQQMTPTPYVIRLNQSFYNPGDVVELSLTSDVGKLFRGFMVRAQRITGDTEEVVGEFIDYPTDAQPKYWYRGSPDSYNCLTHNDNSNKTTITALWRAPSTSVGDIEFRSAFVFTHKEFWVSQTRASLRANQPSTDPIYEAQISETFEPDIDFGQCGKSKGCFLYPSGCKGEKCDYLVTYIANEDTQTVDFEMMGKAEGFLSMAFSQDLKMGDDNTITCMASSDAGDQKVDFQHGYNHPLKWNDIHWRVNFTNIQVEKKENKLYCRFTRPYNMDLIVINEYANPPAARTVSFDLTNPHYIFLGWGSLYPGSFVMFKHKELPIVSKQKIDFLQTAKATGLAMPNEYSLHATFGLLGWMCLAGIGIILARHYRNHLSMQFLGTGAWFQVHRGIAFLVAASTVTCIVIIFLYIEDWTDYATEHAILGLIASGLCLAQIIGGFLRPSTKSNNRIIFTWAHRIGGFLAFILAAICTLLGFDVETVNDSVRDKEVVIVGFWLAFHIIWDIVLELYSSRAKCCLPKGKEEEKDISKTMSAKEVSQPEPQKKEKVSYIKFGLLLIYIVCDFIFFGIAVAYLY